MKNIILLFISVLFLASCLEGENSDGAETGDTGGSGGSGGGGGSIYIAEGEPDTNFGTSGALWYRLTENDTPSVSGGAFDDSGNYYVTGTFGNGSDMDLFVVKYSLTENSDGSYSTVVSHFVYDGGGNEVGKDIIIKDNKLYVAGELENKMTLFKFNQDGSLDTSFNTVGYLTYATSVYSQSFQMVEDSSGNFIIAGNAQGTDQDIAVWRITPAGVFDTTFSGDGLFEHDGGFHDYAMGLHIDSSGKIFVTGLYGVSGPSQDMIVIKLNTDGTLDSSFGGGAVTHDAASGSSGYEEGSKLTTDSSGNVYVVGKASQFPAVWKYKADGTLDASFGTNGYVVKTSSGDQGMYRSVAIDQAGNLVLGGFELPGSNTVAMAVRLTSDGSFDTSFNSDGIYRFPLLDSSGSGYIYDMELSDNGKIYYIGADIDGSSVIGVNIWRMK